MVHLGQQVDWKKKTRQNAESNLLFFFLLASLAKQYSRILFLKEFRPYAKMEVGFFRFMRFQRKFEKLGEKVSANRSGAQFFEGERERERRSQK